MTIPGGLIATLIANKSAVAQAVDAFFNGVAMLVNGENTVFSSTTNASVPYDSSVGGYALTPTSTATSTGFSPYNRANWGVFFSGGSTSTAPYISSSSTAIANFGTGDFTIEVWINPTGIGNATYGTAILDCRAANTANTSVMNIGLGTTYQLAIGNISTTFVTSTPIPTNTWTHIAISRWGTGTDQTAAYINGVPIAIYTDATTYGQAGFFVGTSANALNLAPFVGYMSNFRIVKGRALYGTAGFIPSIAPLTAVPGTTFLGLNSRSFVDTSLLGVPLAPTNNPVIENNGPFVNTQTSNPLNWSQGFNGSTDYLQSTSTYGLAIGTGNFTLECWAQHRGAGANQVIVDTRVASQGLLPMLMVKSTGAPSFYVNSADLITGGLMQPLQWYHIAVVRNSGTTTLYLNGVSVGSAADTNNYTAQGLTLGASGLTADAFGGKLSGAVSNLRLVIGTALYTANFTPPTTALTAIAGTALLTCNNATMADQSNNSIQWSTIAGTPKLVNTSPFDSSFIAGSTKFNGSTDSYTIQPAANLEFGSSDFTVEFMWYHVNAARQWFYSTGTDYWFGIDFNGASNGVLGLWASSNGTSWNLITSDSGGNGISTGAPVLNAWNHVAAVRSGTTWALFLNGKRVLNVTVSGTIINKAAQIKNIGKHATAGYPLYGMLSNFRVVNGTAIYDPAQTTLTVPAANLTAVTNTVLLTFQNGTAVDASASAQMIAPVGTPYQTMHAPFYQNGSSIAFNGSADYITIPSSSALQVGTGDFTFECWFNLATLPATGGISTSVTLFQKGRTATSNFEWGVYVANNSGVYSFILLRSSDGTTLDTLTSNSFTLTANTWVHVAISKYTPSATGTVNWFVNGVFNKTSTFSSGTTIIAGAGAAAIAANNAGAAPLLNGSISNMRIVKGTSLYTATTNFTPSATPLAAISGTSLLVGQGQLIADTSSNAATLTSVGNPIISGNNPFVTRSSTNVTSAIVRNSASTKTTPTTLVPTGGTYFDGASYFTAPSIAGYAMPGAFTYETWVYPSVASVSAQLIGTANSGASQWGIALSPTYGFYFYFGTYGSNQAIRYTGAGTALAKNTWTHVAVSRDASNNWYFFINGVLQSTTDFVSGISFPAAGSFAAGALLLGGGQGGALNGHLYNSRFTVGASLYTSTFSPSTSDLAATANTALLTFRGDGFIDSSSNNAIFTKTGTPVQGYLSPSGYQTGAGNITGGIALDGSSYYAIESSSSFVFTGDFTFECWALPTSNPANGPGTIFDSRASSSATPWNIRIQNDLTVSFYNGSTDTKSTGKVVLNTWNHIAVVRTGSTITFWINGQASGGFTQSGTLGSAAQVLIGTNRTAGYGFYGQLYSLRIVNGTALYSAAFTPPLSMTTVTNTVLLTFQELGAVDKSANAYFLTKTGAGRQTSSIPTTTGGSFAFNGANWFNVGSNPNLAVGTNDFTIECWAFAALNTTNGLFHLSSSYLPGVSTNSLAIGLVSNKVQIYANGTSYQSTGVTVPLNKWSHFALVRQSGITSVYINGVKDTTIGTSGNITDSTNYTGTFMTIGAYNTSSAWNGYISNLRVINGSAMYTGNFSPSTNELAAVGGTALLTAKGTVAIDLSTNNIALVAGSGSPSTSIKGPFSATNLLGQTGGSYFLDGTAALTTPLDTAAFILPTATTPFSIECWVYMTAITSTAILSTVYTGSGAIPFILGMGLTSSGASAASATPSLNYYNGSAWGTGAISSVAIPLNAWTHVAGTYDGTTARIFINGVMTGSWTTSTWPTTASSASIIVGRRWDTANNPYFSGFVTDVRINVGTSTYTSAFVPPQNPLAPMPSTVLLTNGVGPGVIDAAGRQALLSSGSVQVVKSNRKNGLSSLRLPGSSYVYPPTAGTYTGSNGLLIGTGDFTIEMYLNALSFVSTNGNAFIDFRPGSTNGAYITMGISTAGVLSFSTASAIRITGPTLSLNTWYHVALVRASAVTTLYVNGVSYGTYADTNSYLVGANRPIIGVNGFTGTDFFTGYIDDLRISVGTARYLSTFTPPTVSAPAA